MTVDDFRRLFSYTEWANGAFIEALRGLSEEQFARELVSSYPTLRDTIGHMAFAEWLWMRRWKGESPASRPEWAEQPPLSVSEMHLRAVAEERAAYLGTITDDDLQREFRFRSLAGVPYVMRLGDTMSHVVNHATYHRGQLTTMIRQVGAKPPSTDVIHFFGTVER